LEQLIEQFCMERMKNQSSSKNTVQAYKADLYKLCQYLRKNGITSFSNVTETTINSFLLNEERNGRKTSTIVRLNSSLHVFFTYLTKKHITNEDPTERIKSPKFNNTEQQIISVDELNRLMNAPDLLSPKGQRDSAMLELLYSSGMHLNTLLTLTTDCLQLPSPFVAVTEGNENRVLPLGKSAIAALNLYLSDGRKQLQKEHSDRNLLFYNRFGNEMSRQGFFKQVNEYAQKVGISEVSPRILRNSMIVHMMSNGASFGGVHQLMGSKRLSAAVKYRQKAQSVNELFRTTNPRA